MFAVPNKYPGPMISSSSVIISLAGNESRARRNASQVIVKPLC